MIYGVECRELTHPFRHSATSWLLLDNESLEVVINFVAPIRRTLASSRLKRLHPNHKE